MQIKCNENRLKKYLKKIKSKISSTLLGKDENEKWMCTVHGVSFDFLVLYLKAPGHILLLRHSSHLGL